MIRLTPTVTDVELDPWTLSFGEKIISMNTYGSITLCVYNTYTLGVSFKMCFYFNFKPDSTMAGQSTRGFDEKDWLDTVASVAYLCHRVSSIDYHRSVW